MISRNGPPNDELSLISSSTSVTSAPPTDLFHAAYALLLAFSSLIPLTAIAASPPWAVTGQKSPTERRQEAESIMSVALRELEAGHGDEREHEKLLKRRKRRLRKAMQADPYMLVDALEESDNRGFCGIRGSHWMLYVGTLGSVLLWAFALTQGVLGGAQNSTKVSLAQANCKLVCHPLETIAQTDRLLQVPKDWDRLLRPSS